MSFFLRRFVAVIYIGVGGLFSSYIGCSAEVVVLPIGGQNEHIFTKPYSGKFKALNGDIHDVSTHFTSKKMELSVHGIALWKIDQKFTTRVPWFIDIGYQSRLYKVDPVVQFGLDMIIHYQDSSLEIGITNLITLGGGVSESPCVDSFQREFHCGTGLPWVDKPVSTKNNSRMLAVRWTWNF